MNIWRIMTCPAGKRPQKWSKMMKIVQTILVRVHRSMLISRLYICFYIVNKVVKQDFKMTKIKFVPKDQRDYFDLNVNQNQKNPQNPWIKFETIVTFFCCDEVLGELFLHYTKVMIDINWSEKCIRYRYSESLKKLQGWSI